MAYGGPVRPLCVTLGVTSVLSLLFLYLYVFSTIVGPPLYRLLPAEVAASAPAAGGEGEEIKQHFRRSQEKEEEKKESEESNTTTKTTSTPPPADAPPPPPPSSPPGKVGIAGSVSESLPPLTKGASTMGKEEEEKEEWYASVERRFTKRLQRVQEGCKKYSDDLATYKLYKTETKRLYFSGRYNLTVCLVPKVASSTWMVHLHHMRNVTPDTQAIHNAFWKNQIKASKLLGGVPGLRRRLPMSTTVMTTRHPLDRLVSAFCDKFAGGRRLERPQSNSHYRYFWKPALKALKKPIQELHLTFPEFVRYAMKENWEPHWASVFDACLPCDLPYRYIMRLETFTEDLEYLRSKLGIRELDPSQRFNVKAHLESSLREGVSVYERGTLPDNSTIKYFLQIPPYQLAQVIRFYQKDLEVFGYQVPPLLLSRVLNLTQPA